MRTIKKFNIIFLAVGLLLVGCKDEEILRDPSPAANPNSSNVYFSTTNNTNPVLALDQQSFKVYVIREKKAAAQDVTLSIADANVAIFDVPSKVSFPAGIDSAALEIKVKDMELMKKYKLAITIDPEQSRPYAIQAVYPRLDLNVLKEDFAPFAEGTFVSEFFEDSWPLTLEYSPATKIYRLQDAWGVETYDLTFKWDEKVKPGEVNIIGSLNAAKDHISIKTGVIDADYGLVTANYPVANKNYYSSATKTFTFPVKWTVSAGSFGVYPETYTITKEY